MSYRRFLLIALTVSVPATATAQFTTFIPPQNKAKDSVKAAVVAQQRARSDSITAASVTNMRTWVDSAAGVIAPTTATADSANRATPDTTVFRSGSPAPMTASALPLLLLLGIGFLSAGSLLLVRPAGRRRE